MQIQRKKSVSLWWILVATAALCAFTAPPSLGCVGDCNGNREVTVDELITMVNIALGIQPVSNCRVGDANGDGEITIDEIIAAVNNALSGCPPSSACQEAVVTVALELDRNVVTDLAGVTLDLAFPATKVSLPPDALPDRVLDVSNAGGFFDAQLVSLAGPTPNALLVSYVTSTTLDAGPLLEVLYDCSGSESPAEEEFRCTVRQASDASGFTVEGVACSVVVDLE